MILISWEQEKMICNLHFVGKEETAKVLNCIISRSVKGGTSPHAILWQNLSVTQPEHTTYRWKPPLDKSSGLFLRNMSVHNKKEKRDATGNKAAAHSHHLWWCSLPSSRKSLQEISILKGEKHIKSLVFLLWSHSLACGCYSCSYMIGNSLGMSRNGCSPVSPALHFCLLTALWWGDPRMLQLMSLSLFLLLPTQPPVP